MEKQESVMGIITALGAFQADVPTINKSSEAGSGNFKYKYGGLPHIIDTIKPLMKKHNLCFSQPIVTREGVEYIETILYHTKTGESIKGEIALPQVEFKGMNIVQSKGAIITYMRRYALMSTLGLVTDDDDTDAQGQTAANKAATTSAGANTAKANDKPWLNPKTEEWEGALKYLNEGGKIEAVKNKYRISKANEEKVLSDSIAYVAPEPTQEVEPGDDLTPNTLFDEQGNVIQ